MNFSDRDRFILVNSLERDARRIERQIRRECDPLFKHFLTSYLKDLKHLIHLIHESTDTNQPA